jgi:hypothetical protein
VNKHSIFIFALIVVLALGVTAHAQEERMAVATIPFAFEVGGQTLPAGTYTVSRVSDVSQELLISSHEHGVFVLSAVLDATQPGGPLVGFQQVDGRYLLDRVNTPIGEFVIDTHHEVTKLAQVQMHARMTSSGGH